MAEYTWSSFSFDVTAPFENKTVLLSFSLVFFKRQCFSIPVYFVQGRTSHFTYLCVVVPALGKLFYYSLDVRVLAIDHIQKYSDKPIEVSRDKPCM